MNSSRDVDVPTRDVRHLNTVYDLYSSRIVKIERDYIRRRSTNVSCQCNIRRDLMCTCRKAPQQRYFSSPKQVYRYTDWRSFTDIGVGSIKTVPRKRIRKIYLPETVDRGVGSANLTHYINQRSRQQWAGSYYENKITSSKCVGGTIEDENVSLVSKQVSPIIQMKSGTTSPKSEVVLRDQDMNIGNNVKKRKSSISIQVNINELNPKPEPKDKSEESKIKSNQTSKPKLQGKVTKEILPTAAEKLKSSLMSDNAVNCKDYSSDSFVQHVHNLENPSDDKQSKTSVDPMENKLEREYRKIFSSNSKEKPSVDKPASDFKSASLLRRRFEALRRGLGKKESKKESTLINKVTSRTSVSSRKDVSIASDPPSLEGRSYSNTKVYSPYPSTAHEYKPQEKILRNKSPKGKKNKDDSQWTPELGDSKYESVQGMFKLWGKKFNLDEENCKTSPKISNDVSRSPDELSKTESPQPEFSKKKQGRKFFIFGKKTKEKENKPYKPKKGVTAGRCEVKDGLTIKVGGNDNLIKQPVIKQDTHFEKYDNILRKAWLEKYITNTRDSRNSVHIRWNNKMYATSSSTILELMDSVYKQTGINFRSRSEVTTGESSNYHSYTKQRVHFMQQDIEAWMIPKMITNRYQKPSIDYRAYQNNSKCSRWFVDASKGFSQKIELVLRSKSNSKSSEYLIINIPEGYFSHSSSDLRPQSSDEKIYQIVEYDNSELKKIKETRHMATGDNLMNDVKVNDGGKNDNENRDELKIPETGLRNIKKVSSLRDVAIQGSNVFIPKRCDVIGVGIITQRDIRDVKKPVLKIEDELSDEESEENQSISKKKCELAESYLQEYCRNWMPPGIDMFSWHLSDSQHSGNNSVASLSQGDGTKSYPNMYDNFQESTILLSSCETSSCSHCIALEDEKKPDESLKSKILSKFKKKSSESRIADKRNCPKDSLEVYRRRQYYAYTNQKCKWFMDDLGSHSSPSLECKAKTADNQKLHKPCWRIPDDSKKKKKTGKRVSLPGCEEMSRLVDKLSDRLLEGILSFKGSNSNRKGLHSPKHSGVSPEPPCEIPTPPCKETCDKEKKPPCSKKNSPACDEILQPRVNLRSPKQSREMKTASPPRTPTCMKPVKKPPCSACRPQGRMSNESLPRNYLSKTPSQQSGLSLTTSPRISPKQSDACFPTGSKQSDACLPTSKQNKQKECKPNCANKMKFFSKLINTPPTPPPTAYHMPQTNGSREMTGLHLKKLPSKKRTNSDECFGGDGPGVIRLNSQEKFTVRMKKETPSTEEIRESLNIKVQDEGGQTLFERIDYKQSGDVNKCLLLKDVFKDPQIHRVSTPITVQENTVTNKSQNALPEAKSDCSIDNLIEINFTLKLKQGDKGTEVNINDDGDAEVKHKIDGKITESQKNICTMQNRTEPQPAVSENKKDVNIKIVIKNYRNDPEKYNETEMYAAHNAGNEVFNKRISEKFQSVSTGYSDIDQHAFSIHRATVDLTTSVDRLGTLSNPDECITSKLSVSVPKNRILSSHSVIEHSAADQLVNYKKYNNDEVKLMASDKKSSTNNGRNSSVISLEETDKFEKERCSIEESKNHIVDTVDENSNDSVLYKKIRLHNRAEKKEMLKKLLRSSSAIKKPENKKRTKEIIRAILTSDSSGTELAETSNELAKELTYGSLDPSYFRDTDSMNNYYQLDGEFSNDEIGQDKLNPTKDNSGISDNQSDVSSEDDIKHGCMCSALATKLNISLDGGYNNCGCCCKRNVKRDEEINCDVGTDDCVLDLKACMDVETQSSKHVLNKLNSANISIRSKTQSVVIANTSVTIKKSIEDPSVRKYSTYQPINDVKYYGMKTLNRQTLLGLSDDEMLVLNSDIIQKTVSKSRRKKTSKHSRNKHEAADILQLNETKKAVLEIYKERILSDEGEQLVAKLPKFDVEKENELTNYEDIVSGRRRIGKRNFVMMTINR